MEKPRWGRRWLVVRLTLLWCAVIATWIIIFGPDDRVRETALLAIATLSASVIGAHLGFASWTDRTYLKEGSRLRTPREPEQ